MELTIDIRLRVNKVDISLDITLDELSDSLRLWYVESLPWYYIFIYGILILLGWVECKVLGE